MSPTVHVRASDKNKKPRTHPSPASIYSIMRTPHTGGTRPVSPRSTLNHYYSFARHRIRTFRFPKRVTKNLNETNRAFLRILRKKICPRLLYYRTEIHLILVPTFTRAAHQ